MAVQLQTFDPVTVAVANTAYPLSSEAIPVVSVTIQAEFTNVSKLLVGSSNLDSSNAIEIPPGDTAMVITPVRPSGNEEFLMNEIFVTSTTSGDIARIVAWRRRP